MGLFLEQSSKMSKAGGLSFGMLIVLVTLHNTYDLETSSK